VDFIHSALGGVCDKFLNEGRGDLFGRCELWLVRVTCPGLFHSALSKSKVTHCFPANHIVYDLLSFALKAGAQITGFTKNLGAKSSARPRSEVKITMAALVGFSDSVNRGWSMFE